MKKNKIKINYIISILITIFFIVGLKSFNDYGISIDEKFHRENGLSQYNYIKNFFSDSNDKKFIEKLENNIKNKTHFDNVPSIQPSFFDLISEFCIDIFDIKSIDKIFKFKHLFNYFIFCLSLIFFFKIIYKRYSSKFLATISSLGLFLHPRILSNSFYNQKDIFFMSIFIIFSFFFLKYLDNQKNKYVFILSVLFAILFVTRIFSILILFLFLIFSFLYFKDLSVKLYKHFLSFIAFSFLIIFLFWPYLWSNPVNNFIFGIKELISYSPSYTILFEGNYISSKIVPVYYYLKWIIITSPIFYIVLLSVGIILFSKKLYQDEINFNKKKNFTFDTFLLSIFFSIICLTIVSKKGYNGWRHIYFLAPIIIYFFSYAIKEFMSSKNRLFKNLIYFLIIICFTQNINWLVKNHPYGNVYFNELINDENKKKFELDYWGLSNFNSIKYILEQDNSNLIEIGTLSFTSLPTTKLIFNKKEFSRIKILSYKKKPKYLIDNKNNNFKKNLNVLKDYELYNEIKINNLIINSIYKKNEKLHN